MSWMEGLSTSANSDDDASDSSGSWVTASDFDATTSTSSADSADVQRLRRKWRLKDPTTFWTEPGEAVAEMEALTERVSACAADVRAEWERLARQLPQFHPRFADASLAEVPLHCPLGNAPVAPCEQQIWSTAAAAAQVQADVELLRALCRRTPGAEWAAVGDVAALVAGPLAAAWDPADASTGCAGTTARIALIQKDDASGAAVAGPPQRKRRRMDRSAAGDVAVPPADADGASALVPAEATIGADGVSSCMEVPIATLRSTLKRLEPALGAAAASLEFRVEASQSAHAWWFAAPDGAGDPVAAVPGVAPTVAAMDAVQAERVALHADLAARRSQIAAHLAAARDAVVQYQHALAAVPVLEARAHRHACALRSHAVRTRRLQRLVGAVRGRLDKVRKAPTSE